MIDTIELGDAYELIKKVPDKSIDLIVTDPPYKIDGVHGGTGIFRYKNFSYGEELKKDESRIVKGIDLSILDEFVRVMKKVNCYIWCNKEQIYDYMTFFVKERGCNFEILVWNKQNVPPFYSGHYIKDKEYCLFFWERGVDVHFYDFESAKTVFISMVNMKDKKLYGHPTIKPENIIEKLIANSSSVGDVVLDHFSGSGTTCAVAKRTGRRFIGFEIDEDYFKNSIDRLNGITKKEMQSGYVQEKLF